MEAAVHQGLFPSSCCCLSQELGSKQRAWHPCGPTAAPGWQTPGDRPVLTLHLQSLLTVAELSHGENRAPPG